MSDEGLIMTNTEFDFSFAGKTYKVKKANLVMVMDFQRKVAEIQKEKDPAADLRIGAYALYLVLHTSDSTITEQYVNENCPGDTDIVEIIKNFGFMSQRKMVMLGQIGNLLENKKPTGEESSAS
jgi:microcompartment protein CcmK/EutM